MDDLIGGLLVLSVGIRFAVELVVPPNPPASPTTEEIVSKLYPDRAKFNKEEQRRFELLVAHWDVPLNRTNFDTINPRR